MKKTTLMTFAAFFAIALVIVSCQSDSQFPGYEKTDSGLFYKFHKQGTDTVTPKVNDYITIDMIYGTEDSVFFDSKMLPQVMKMPLIEPTYQGDIYDGMTMMNIGDSVTFICNADSTFKKLFRMNVIPPELDSVEYLYFHIKMNNIESEEAVKKAQDEEMQNLEAQESLDRNKFLEEKYPNAKPVESGLYYIQTKKGSGSHPQSGQKVKVHYKGMFLDGNTFDSSFDRDEPIEFTLGQGQVISGWDEGIAMMRKGGKATLVIPSDIAYGPRGRGSIPPFSTLVFEVELIEIN